MKHALFIFFCLAGLCFAQDEDDAPNTKPDAGGVVIEPSKGTISPGDELTITFPRAMIPADRIDVAELPCPFVSQPKIDGTFLWKSQTEGTFTVRGVVAGARHRLTLAPRLTDSDGKAIVAKGWSAEFKAPEFSISTDFDERAHLSSRPQIPLDSTYDVSLTECAEHIYFQDRDSRQRFPIEVIAPADQQPGTDPLAKEFRVVPREPLPVDHAYDLVVDGLVEAKDKRPLPYPKVFPAGKTESLKVDWVGAHNAPLDEPLIRIKLTDSIDPSEATPERIHVEPAVPEMELLAAGDEIDVKGKFDLRQHYRVTISPELKGELGYSLAAESRWGATFHPKNPLLVFPSSEVFLRARTALKFAFVQINTPAGKWRLAQIPPEKLGAVKTRVREFERSAIDPLTGKTINDPETDAPKPLPTELLVDAFELPVIGDGKFEASSDDENTQREIRCAAPVARPLSGAYLLEASAPLAEGKIVGNRSIIFASDFILTQKRTPTLVVLRVAKMSDAQPVAGVTIRAVTDENIERSRETTDKNGCATFARDALFPPKQKEATIFIADTANGPALQLVEAGSYSSGEPTARVTHRPHAEIITDRNLYRPGQTVKMKGLVRLTNGGDLSIPLALDVAWRILPANDESPVAEGKSTLTNDGGWEAEWQVPESAKLGHYTIRCRIGEEDYEGTADLDVEEYRVPLFSIVTEAKPEVGTAAHAHVASEYFHGAPNVGARLHWKATWTASAETSEGDYKHRYNSMKELGPRLDAENEQIKTVEGDAKLDAHGFAELSCDSPFKDDRAIARANIAWRIDVTSLDGQTITGGEIATLFSSDARLGVKTEELLEKTRGVKVSIDATDKDDESVEGVAVHADLFHITTKTVKEQIAPFVYRYRNFDQFAKVASQDGTTPAELIFPASETGRYAAAVSATKIKTPLVSDETTVSGEEPAELPVENETTFKIEHRAEPFVPGEKAELSVQAPFGGVAWVSVETDEILDTMLVPLQGNAARIELPIKKEYAPNATVAVYLVRPGGEKDLPRERFAISPIEVRRPDRELKIETHLASATIRPGETVRGEVRVTSENKPVSEADLAVFAVDDAVLKLGEWQMPDLLPRFYRANIFGVRTYQALRNYVEEIKRTSLTQKGFIIGDGGDDTPVNTPNVRKEFRTLAFWNGSMKTNAEGKVAFEFPAPDNLTTYRVVAIGQTKASQFGGDAAQTIKVSKPLLIDPALPRFLRNGDEVELRAVVRQNFADNEEITAHCVTDSNCKLLAADRATQSAQRDAPVVFRFKAKLADTDLAPIKVKFEAVAKSDPQMSDAVEMTLPVLAPTIVRKESVAGQFNGPKFDARAAMPNDWKRGHGNLSATVSTSPWLPKIAGLPTLLEYPHGCFEQISSRLLGYSLLANLLAYLPNAEARDAEYRATLERGMKQFNSSLLAEGMLPYWPGGETGHAFVTCQAFWAVNESVKAGFEAPENLREKLAGALKKIINGQAQVNAMDKCFALFVLTQFEPNDDYKAASQELYLRRNECTDEGRAFLAIALHRQQIMARETDQLLREIDLPIKERAFDPATFTSVTRAEAIRAVAFNTIAPKNLAAQKRQGIRERMLKLMESSASLSTQENLWLLLAFESLLEVENPPSLNAAAPLPKFSKNHRSGAWIDRKLGDDLIVDGLNQSALTFLLQAEYSTDETQTDRVDRGFRVERVVKNLTDSKRNGSAETPFKIGDQILITYRMNTRKLQNYVALEDELPAGLETVNPNLAMIGKFFEMPPTEPNERVLWLSHSELRDRANLLYFDIFDPGSGTYSVLARATAAGTFRWPATQVVPMYDSRFSGLSPSSVCVVVGE